MDERLVAIERARGVFLRREAHDCGYDEKAVRSALKIKLWHRVRHGAYCSYANWASADPERRHWILARAVMRATPGPVALSHHSALIAQGVAVWGADLSVVHVTRLDGAPGRRNQDVVHHQGVLTEGDLWERDGMLVTRASRSVLDASSVSSVESGLVSADSALHQTLVSPDELWSRYRSMDRWPGMRKVQLVVRLADGGAASPGESRSRYIFWTQNLPAPLLQFPVHDADGVLIGISDFGWPEHRLLGEFDGKVKYGRLLLPGQEPGDVVFAEKRREDRMREVTQWRVARLVWDDLAHPRLVGARFASLLGVAA